ncbi:MAG: SpoIVB peptidase S55 domain-containing protein, partial [Limnochordia bacterium]
MRKLPLWLGMAVLVIICGISAQVLAVELFPPEEVRPGLRGIGKTVFSGNAIETFDVEVLGIIPQSPPVSSYIMVKVSGEAIERYGGIARGMSGSPVY